MATLRRWLLRLYHAIRPGAGEAELDRELKAHLALLEDEYERRGLTSDAARVAARQALGGLSHVRDLQRDARSIRWLSDLAGDVRYAARTLRRAPVFAMCAVLSLTIGIGSNAAIFNLVDAVLLRTLPVRDADSVVLMAEVTGSSQNVSMTTPQFKAIQHSPMLAGAAAFRPWRMRVTVQDAPRLVDGQLVSGDYFSTLGLPMVRGRALGPADDQPGAPLVAVMSERFWRHDLRADPAIVGSALEIQGASFTIVGVIAAPFSGLEPGKNVDLAVPLATQPTVMPGSPLLTSTNARWLRLIGRLAPGVTREQAQASLVAPWTAASPLSRGARVTRQLELLPGGQGLYDLRREFETPLHLLMLGVGLVLLLACVNLSGILLARGASRRHEIDLRYTLGAGRGRLIRQLLAESLLLSVIGAVCGAGLAAWIGPALVRIMSTGTSPMVLDLAPQTRSALFLAGVTAATTVLVGLLPALRLSHTTRSSAYTRVSRRRVFSSRALLAGEVTVCFIVVCCAALLVTSVRKLRTVDPGFDASRVLLMSIRPGISGYDAARGAQLYQELLGRFSRLPGVRAATVSMDVPLEGVSYTTDVSTTGDAGDVRDLHVAVNSVGPRFFATYGIPIPAGRDFTDRDDAHAPLVAVVTRSAARALFGDAGALGRRVSVGGAQLEVVGVASDAVYGSLREAASPMIYRPYLQMPNTWEELFFALNTSEPPLAIVPMVQQTLRDAAPTVPMFSLSTLDMQVDRVLVRERVMSILSAWLAAFALVLVGIGLYGRLALDVADRRREIGIRMALGEARPAVVWGLVRELCGHVLAGLVIGVPVGIAASALTKSLLYGVTPADPRTLAIATAMVMLMVAAAAWVPARRAARMDPAVLLREE